MKLVRITTYCSVLIPFSLTPMTSSLKQVHNYNTRSQDSQCPAIVSKTFITPPRPEKKIPKEITPSQPKQMHVTWAQSVPMTLEEQLEEIVSFARRATKVEAFQKCMQIIFKQVVLGLYIYVQMGPSDTLTIASTSWTCDTLLFKYLTLMMPFMPTQKYGKDDAVSLQLTYAFYLTRALQEYSYIKPEEQLAPDCSPTPVCLNTIPDPTQFNPTVITQAEAFAAFVIEQTTSRTKNSSEQNIALIEVNSKHPAIIYHILTLNLKYILKHFSILWRAPWVVKRLEANHNMQTLKKSKYIDFQLTYDLITELLTHLTRMSIEPSCTEKNVIPRFCCVIDNFYHTRKLPDASDLPEIVPPPNDDDDD